ncbi:dipeptidase 1-like [Montipora foliosa]|uniref:dipeptidase 1-like n=1 Tax=Montipora foliosa TaxID=591990 RepID=UPI0035F165EA
MMQNDFCVARYFFGFLFALSCLIYSLGHSLPRNVRQASDYDTRAQKILEQTPLVDGHNDLPWQLRKNFMNQLENVTLNTNNPEFHTDIPRLRKGRVGAQFWAAYVSCRNQFTDSVRLFSEQIDVILRMVDKYSNDFVFVTTAQGIKDAHKDNKIASLIGVEGGHSMDSSLDTLRMLFDMGGRYMTLTHACHTPWADSCTPEQPAHNGLTEFGKIVVKEMNRLGMFIDISHVSHKVMHDVLDVTKAPVIFSHSSAYALCDHPRNVPDDVLIRMRQNGGVVMVNFYNDYVTCSKSATLNDVADHIDYIKNLSGIDHVGLGSDYDGVPRVPTGLEDVSTFPKLIAELLRRGYSDEDVSKVVGRNLLTAMERMEKVAADKKTMLPFDDFILVNKTCRPIYGGF